MKYKYIGLNPVRIGGKIINPGDKVESKHDMTPRLFRPFGIYSAPDVAIKKPVKKTEINKVKIKRKRGKKI